MTTAEAKQRVLERADLSDRPALREMLKSHTEPESEPVTHTLTVIVPAYNEEAMVAETVDALLAQTVPAERIIVVNDHSTDRTPEILASYGDKIDVMVPEEQTGSKARAQNYALQFCDTDLVLPVDGDTILGPEYIERIKPSFVDEEVAIAAGCVQTQYSRSVVERGRTIEYLHGFHWQRPVQNMANSPVVCSGCCSVFRTQELKDFGGFPERTVVEDMDYTWSKQIEGRKAVYIANAEAWAADPENVRFLRIQMWRWMAGFFQNVRIHFSGFRHKPMLGLWILLAVLEIFTAPLWWTAPVLFIGFLGQSVENTLLWWAGFEMMMTVPPLLYGIHKRKLNYLSILVMFPCVYFNKVINFYYAWKAMVVELMLVPLGLSEGLVVYEKGN